MIHIKRWVDKFVIVIIRYMENISVMKRQLLGRVQDSAFALQDHVTRVHRQLVDIVDDVTREEERNIERK